MERLYLDTLILSSEITLENNAIRAIVLILDMVVSPEKILS